MKSVKVMGWNDQGIETFDVVGIEDHSITRSDFDLIEIALGDMDCSKLNEMEWYEIVLEPKWEDDGSGQKCLDWYEIKTVKVYDSNSKILNNPPAFSNVMRSLQEKKKLYEGWLIGAEIEIVKCKDSITEKELLALNGIVKLYQKIISDLEEIINQNFA